MSPLKQRETSLQTQFDSFCKHDTTGQAVSACPVVSCSAFCQFGDHLLLSDQYEQACLALKDTLQQCDWFRRSILDAFSAHIAVLDSQGTILVVNRAWETFAHENGIDANYVSEGANYFAVCDQATDDDAELCYDFVCGMRTVLTGRQDSFEMEYPCHSANEQRWFVGYVTRFAINDRVFLVVTHENITARRHMEDALRESEFRYRAVSELVSDYAYALRVEPDGTMVREWDTEAQRQTTGYSGEELDSFTSWVQVVHPLDMPIALRHMQRLMEGSADVSEFRIIMRNGNVRWLRDYCKPVWDAEQHRVVRIYGASQDITRRKTIEHQMRHMALHDRLTGLPNRTLFLQMLGQAIRRARQHATYLFGVIYLDLDNFKVVNDGLGHVEGDRLLTTIAHRLKNCVRSGDTVARFSGDEFVILLDHLSAESDAIDMVQRIQHELTQPLNVHNHTLIISASIGIVLGTAAYARATDVLRDADTAMYYAKSFGPGRFMVFDAVMHDRVVHRMQTEAALRYAIEHDELYLAYQPIVSLKTGCIVGCEALVRWQHPRQGVISPGVFIPIAEETGLIVPITWWVLEEACRQMQSWHRQFPTLTRLTINVNMSVAALMCADVSEKVHGILDRTGLDARYLKLEITENIMMDHAAETLSTLAYLRTMGIQWCIDDFGTGYSSLQYLHRLPIQALKIDRSFVGTLYQDDESAAIIQSIITLSHTLGKEVVAEGIETVEQLDYLRGLQCEYGQGYLFSRPVSSSDMSTLLISQVENGASQRSSIDILTGMSLLDKVSG